MLSHLQIRNFKAWRDTGRVRLAPLTVFFGTNSSGKSSLGHLLLALKQTALSTDRRRPLHLGDENSLIDLGTYADCVHRHDLRQALEITLGWRTLNDLVVHNPLLRSESYKGNELELRSRIVSSSIEQPEIDDVRYRLNYVDRSTDTAATVLEVSNGTRDGSGTVRSTPLKLRHAPGRKWPAEPPEKFYRFSDRTLLRYQNAGFLVEFMLETERVLNQFFYLGPLRSYPRRVYQWSGDMPPDVGLRGEFAVAALLAATNAGRSLNRGRKQRTQRFDAFVATWLKELGVISNFSVKQVAKGRKEYEVLVQTHEGSAEVKLTDVGFGVSQILPALVQAFYAPHDSVIWMEQPEIHLHPQVQSNLADAFISAVQAWEDGRPRNTQLIVESHSEHFLSRLQRRVAEGVIAAEDVAIYFVSRSGVAAEVQPLHLNDDGDIENWPENFFGDEMADVAARMRAAAEKKMKAQNSGT